MQTTFVRPLQKSWGICWSHFDVWVFPFYVPLHLWVVPYCVWVIHSHIWVVPSCIVDGLSWGVPHIWVVPFPVVGSPYWGVPDTWVVPSCVVGSTSCITYCILFGCLPRIIEVSCTYSVCHGSFASKSVVDSFHCVAVHIVHFSHHFEGCMVWCCH